MPSSWAFIRREKENKFAKTSPKLKMPEPAINENFLSFLPCVEALACFLRREAFSVGRPKQHSVLRLTSAAVERLNSTRGVDACPSSLSVYLCSSTPSGQ